jgi:hypothetical protein
VTNALRIAALAALTTALAACGYTLQGKAVPGDYSAIQIVDADDPRLQHAGIANVRLHLQNDPNTLRRETVAKSTTTNNGDINIPIDLPGAGFLNYDLGLYARKEGYAPAERLFSLPPKHKRLLIVLAPGQDRDLGEERDLDRDLERFGP